MRRASSDGAQDCDPPPEGSRRAQGPVLRLPAGAGGRGHSIPAV